MTTLTATQLQQQYIAYFGRPGDPAGIKYWLSSSSGVSSAREFADKIYAQDEYKKSTVGTKSTEAQVDSLYQNLFGRSADAAGLLYWTGEIEAGNLSLSNVAYDLIWAATNPVASNSTQAALDAQALSNKVDAAVAFTAAVEADASAILAYQPASTDPFTAGEAFTDAVTFIASATSSNAPTAANVTSAITDVKTTTGSTATSKALVLTASTDNIIGGDGNDTITGSSSTFNSDDNIDGGLGIDTFVVTASGADSVIGNFSNTEVIKATNGGAAGTDYAINLIGATGLTELTSRLSTGEVSFDNVPTAVTVTSYGGQASSLTTAGFLNSLTTGTADSISLKLDAGATTTFQVSGTTATNEFETINIESAGSAKNTVEGLTDAGTGTLLLTKNVNVSGTAPIEILLANGASAGATYSGSAATGAQTVTWGGNYTSLTTGSGDDKIDIKAGSFFGSTDPKTVDGGTGTDTLVLNENLSALTSNDADTKHSVTGIETLELQAKLADGAALDLARSHTAGTITADKFLLTGENNDGTAAGDAGEDVSFAVTGLTTEAVDVSFKASATNTNDETVTLTMKDDTGAADSLTVTSVEVADQVNSFALTIDRLASAANNKVETLNFVASTSDVSTTDGTTLQALTAAYTETINISGAKDLTITTVQIADPAGDATATFDASALTGNLTLSSGFKTTAADTITIKLGSGTNTIDYAAEGLSADVVTGSTGTDTVKILEGATDNEMTITSVDNVELKGAGATKDISIKNYTDVTTIKIRDNAAASDGTDNIKVTNIPAGTKFELYSHTTTDGDWDGDTITLDMAKDVTSTEVTLKGAILLEGTGAINTDATTLTITDAIKTSDYFVSQTVVVAGTDSTAKLGTLNLGGGGASSATATAALTVSGTSNVDIATLDASALDSDLVISGLTTKTGAKVTLGSGDNKLTLALADLARDALTVDGGAGTDRVIATALDNATYRLAASNLEELELDVDASTNGNIIIDGSDASSVTTILLGVNHASSATDDNTTVQEFANLETVKLQGVFGAATGEILNIDDTGATTLISDDTFSATNGGLSLADATSLTIKLGSSASDANTAEFSAAVLTATKATSITLGGSDSGTDGVEFVGKLDIPSVSAPAATSLTVNSQQGDVDLHTLTAAKLTSLTITGDNNVTVGDVAATTTLLATVDASAATDVIIIGDFLNVTASGTVKTGTANDEVTLSVTTEGNVTLDMGEKTSDNDTLKFTGANNLGITAVDLSATDQITQVNGVNHSAASTGVESIDGSGMTGTYGLSITGSADDNTIVGSPVGDNLTAGEGTDIIQGGAGNDTIDVSESTAKADKIKIDSKDTNGVDTITGFDVASDVIWLVAVGEATEGAISLAKGTIKYQEADGSVANGTGIGVYVDTSDNLISTTDASVRTSFGGATTDEDSFFYVASDGTDSHLFHVHAEGTAINDSSDLVTHLATIKGLADASTLARTNFATDDGTTITA